MIMFMKTNIYIIKNKYNDKVYIGQSKNVEKRFKNHMLSNTSSSLKHKKIAKDIEKYGREAFYYEILAENIDIELARSLEYDYILKYDSVNSGYNHSMNTNEKGFRNDSCKKKISEAQMGEKNHMYGKTPSNARRVLCITTGEIFDTATKCAKYYNLCISKICAVCRGERKTHGKMKFKYID